MRNLKASDDLGTHKKKLTGILDDINSFVRYRDTIDTQPTGYENLSDSLLCWEWGQLDWQQQWSTRQWFYIGNSVDMSKYESNQYKTTDEGKRWVWTCRSSGSSR